jgi:chromosome segregation ATPase
LLLDKTASKKPKHIYNQNKRIIKMAELGIPPPPAQHKGLFHSNKPPQQDFGSFSDDISNLGRRLRMLEESFTNLRRALQVTEQNMLSKHKVFSTETRTIISDISDLKKEIADIKEKMLEIVKEIQSAAKRDEVRVLERYINLWNPVKFVTQNEVEQIVKEMLVMHSGKK